jgi:hypothetical protein
LMFSSSVAVLVAVLLDGTIAVVVAVRVQQ